MPSHVIESAQVAWDLTSPATMEDQTGKTNSEQHERGGFGNWPDLKVPHDPRFARNHGVCKDIRCRCEKAGRRIGGKNRVIFESEITKSGWRRRQLKKRRIWEVEEVQLDTAWTNEKTPESAIEMHGPRQIEEEWNVRRKGNVEESLTSDKWIYTAWHP